MTYEAWRISFQSSEQAAQAAYKEWQKLAQCSGCAVQQGYVPVETLSAEIKEPPAHSMSMYASKDDMLAAVMRENEELRAKLVAEAARTAEQKLRADQMTEQHAMQAKMHAQASAQLAAVQRGVQAVIGNTWSFCEKTCIASCTKSGLQFQLEDGEMPHEYGHAFADMMNVLDATGKTPSELLATHPTQQGLEQDAARYRVVRRGQHWSVIDGIGNELRGDELDAAADRALAAQAKQGGV